NSGFQLSRTPLLQLLKCARPVSSEETRHRSISQQLPPSLTSRTVVRLVSRVDDPLNRPAALGTRFAVAPVHGHLRSEGSDLLGKVLFSLITELVHPKPQGCHGCFEQTLNL